jgi:flavin-dependent dehydrogenase
MPDVIVIGDGPGGLSAALFLAKNKMDVVVFGEDKTAMHWAASPRAWWRPIRCQLAGWRRPMRPR